MQQFTILLYFYLFVFLSTFCQASPSRKLIILRDKNNIESISNSRYFLLGKLESALKEQEAPIIVNSGLLFTFLQKQEIFKFRSANKENGEHKLLDIYNSINNRLNYWFDLFSAHICDRTHSKSLMLKQVNSEFYNNKRTKRVYERKHICELAIFLTKVDWSQWDIYTVDSLYILIPKRYSSNLLNSTDSGKLLIDEQYTVEEAALGIAVNHLQKVKMPFDNLSIFLNINNSSSQFFLESIKKILVPKVVYSLCPYEWNMVFCGHGWPEHNSNSGVVCDLRLEEFKDFLNFLDANLAVHFLWYISCFAGGKNWQLLFNDQKSYHYGIITSGLNDGFNIGYGVARITLPFGNNGPLLSTEDIEWDNASKKWSLKINYDDQWGNLFHALKETSFNDTDLQQIESAKWSVSTLHYLNLPSIKLPNIQDTIHAYGSATLKINDATVLVHSALQVPLIIDNYYRGILLDCSCVDISLMFSHENEFPQCIPVQPGQSLYYFYHIEALKVPFDKIIASFWPSSGAAFEKIFYFKELICAAPGPDIAKILEVPNRTLIFRNLLIISSPALYLTIFAQTEDGRAFAGCVAQSAKKLPELVYLSVLDHEATCLYLSRCANVQYKAILTSQERVTGLFEAVRAIKK